MNGKKARAARRAAGRSVASTQSRLARKAAKVERSAVEREFDVELAKARRERDQALAAAGEAYRKGLEDLKETLTEARATAYRDYDGTRAELVKHYASKERAAA